MNKKYALISFVFLILATLACQVDLDNTSYEQNDQDSDIPNKDIETSKADHNYEETHQIIDLDDISPATNPPDDIIDQIFFGGLGGPGDMCENIEEIESNNPLHIYDAIMGTANWCACGLSESVGEEIAASLNSEDGDKKNFSSEVYESDIDLGNCVMFQHSFTDSAEDSNAYTFETHLSGKNLKDHFILYNRQIVFDGFSPNEKIRLIIYDNFGVFYNQVFFKADQVGKLSVATPNDLFVFQENSYWNWQFIAVSESNKIRHIKDHTAYDIWNFYTYQHTYTPAEIYGGDNFDNIIDLFTYGD